MRILSLPERRHLEAVSLIFQGKFHLTLADPGDESDHFSQAHLREHYMRVAEASFSQADLLLELAGHPPHERRTIFGKCGARHPCESDGKEA